MLCRLALIVLAALAGATAGYGQAAVEYALKSSGGAVGAAGANAAIGSCRVDSTLLTCLSHTYRKTTIIVIGLLVIMILRKLTRMHAARS